MPTRNWSQNRPTMPLSSPMHCSSWSAREESRIRTHLFGALAVLRAGDVASLEAPARAARARNIDELERYVAAGQFPRSPFREGPRHPALVDRWGTRCALAHLIEKSGGGALLARLRALDNHAWVRELAGDAALVGWLGAAGLSAAEAARIQPSYSPYPTAFRCACSSLHSGGAIGKLLSALPVTESGAPRLCRVRVEEVLASPTSKKAPVVGSEIDAVCPARPVAGAKVLLADENSRDDVRPPAPSGMVARAIMADTVTLLSTCDVGSPYMGERQPSATVSLVRIREALKGDPDACQAAMQGIPYDPLASRRPRKARSAAPTPPEVSAPAPTPPEVSAAPVEAAPPRATEQAEEKPAPSPDLGFPQPVHYLAAGGTLLVAGTAAFFVLKRRG